MDARTDRQKQLDDMGVDSLSRERNILVRRKTEIEEEHPDFELERGEEAKEYSEIEFDLIHIDAIMEEAKKVTG